MKYDLSTDNNLLFWNNKIYYNDNVLSFEELLIINIIDNDNNQTVQIKKELFEWKFCIIN